MKKLLYILILLSACITEPYSDDLLNYYRTHGAGGYGAVKPLEDTPELQYIAQIHADHMEASGHFSHTWEDGTGLAGRFQMAGVTLVYAGENIAVGQKTEDEAIEAWVNSPCHCKNLMDSKFSKVGIANSGNYWVMVLSK